MGTIVARSGDLAIGTGNTGLRFSDGDRTIYPFDSTVPNEPPAVISLGDSGSTFKDLYLSGGLYVGGTGSANFLDDYEEGTFTPQISGSGGAPTITHSIELGTYVKVGNLVQVTVSVGASGTPSGGSGDFIITGLPFTTKSGFQQAGSAAFTNILTPTSGTTQMGCNVEGGVTYINVNEHEYSGTSSMNRVQVSALY